MILTISVKCTVCGVILTVRNDGERGGGKGTELIKKILGSKKKVIILITPVQVRKKREREILNGSYRVFGGFPITS